jgi:hypothetical protein
LLELKSGHFAHLSGRFDKTNYPWQEWCEVDFHHPLKDRQALYNGIAAIAPFSMPPQWK